MNGIDQSYDRIALIYRGRIIAVGTPAALKAKAAPNATLDDVFVRLVSARDEKQGTERYGDVRRARRAERKRG
jgi:ABC-2 type transport system ATP-binding protein